MKKNIKLGIILGILFILCLPVFSNIIVGSWQPYEINENRVRAQYPEGNKFSMVSDRGEYCKEIEGYFNDNFTFRDILIRTKNQINYSIFKQAPGVYLGKDGYLSYKSVISIEQYQNELLSKDYYRDVSKVISEIGEKLRGSEFVFLTPPQKNTVFPDRAIEFPVIRPENNSYYKLIDSLKQVDTNLYFIDLLPILRDSEVKHPTYYRTDFHWNGYGATVAFTEVVNRFFEKEGNEKRFSESDYAVTPLENFKGGQLNEFSIFENISESTVQCIKKTSDISKMLESNDTKEYRHYVNSNPDAPLGTVLFIGDSYTDYMLSSNSGILECFKEVYFIHVNISENALSQVPDNIDYVVFERIESAMPYLLDELKSTFSIK